ncbi:MAG: 2-C-methyl-D-erythritol 4-phosphate cytidylyltransferase [Actinomycetota bacterium]|nr:2-C-methyl-D-erythritol 4-phosphate cytidylyltransferase [Actinomycetota bacterium]
MDGAVAVILAGGSGERLGAHVPKAFVELAGSSLLSMAARAADESPAIGQVLAVVPAGYEDRARESLGSGLLTVVPGGATRQASVRAALEALDSGATPADVVVCHDAARPFASPDLFTAVMRGLGEADGVIPVIPLPDTVKRVRDGRVLTTERRDELALAQTPQAFRRRVLRSAHARAAAEDLEFTDDSALVEWTRGTVHVILGEQENFKITTPADLLLARAMAKARSG